jgi:hypothetical protein
MKVKTQVFGTIELKDVEETGRTHLMTGEKIMVGTYTGPDRSVLFDIENEASLKDGMKYTFKESEAVK